MDLINTTLVACLLTLTVPGYALLRLLAFGNLPMPLGIESRILLAYGLLIFVLAACFAIAALCSPSAPVPADND